MALRQLFSAKSLEEAIHLVCATGRRLTGADGTSLVFCDKKQCVFAGEDAIAPLWKGQCFDSGACISGWVMENREPALIPDIRRDSRITLDLYRKTFVRSLIMVPVHAEYPIGAIGAYWAKEHSATPDLVAQLQTLADFAAIAIGNLRRRSDLESRVAQAEAELLTTQRKLAAEIHLRSQREERLQLVEQTDPLTGLNNRHGFLSHAGQIFKLINRVSVQAWLIYIDLDGLRQINCSLGYDAGDRVIQNAARVLRESVRESDTLARVRDDEFIAFAIAASDPVPEIEARLIRNINHLNQCQPGNPPLTITIGAVRCDPRGQTTLEDLIHQADAAMYLTKRLKRLKIVENQTS
jgi:diguanylate cyclase (GGDEF)-like protein